MKCQTAAVFIDMKEHLSRWGPFEPGDWVEDTFDATRENAKIEFEGF
jgi:hypothetical protein